MQTTFPRFPHHNNVSSPRLPCPNHIHRRSMPPLHRVEHLHFFVTDFRCLHQGWPNSTHTRAT